jgi:hypothetical protein
MRFSLPRLSFYSLCLLALACDNARSHGARDAVVSAPVRAYIEALCEGQERCGEAAFEACLQRRLITCRPGWAELGSADLPTLDACLDALQAQPCAERRLTISACNAVRQVLNPNAQIREVVPAGAACGGTTSCTTRTYCRGGSVIACGVCEPQREAGAHCGDDPGTCLGFCDVESGLCAPPRELGEACPFSDQCGPGLECVEGTCLNPQLGYLCNSVCRDDSLCIDGRCAATKQEGDACSSVVECAIPFVCSQGRCQLPTQCGTGQLGDPCVDWSCESPLACQDGVCIKLRPRRLGQSCDLLRDACEEGAACLDSLCKTWNRPAFFGEACRSDGDCLQGMVCDNQRCRWGEPLCSAAVHTPDKRGSPSLSSRVLNQAAARQAEQRAPAGASEAVSARLIAGCRDCWHGAQAGRGERLPSRRSSPSNAWRSTFRAMSTQG